MRQSCKPYRGYAIEVQLSPSRVLSFAGLQRRYAVSWSIYSANDAVAPVANFPERVNFLTDEAAYRYGEDRAHAFIDCLMANKWK
ncbi:hypothetical protein PBS_15030 [Paraburkholderia sp. 2C]